MARLDCPHSCCGFKNCKKRGFHVHLSMKHSDIAAGASRLGVSKPYVGRRNVTKSRLGTGKRLWIDRLTDSVGIKWTDGDYEYRREQVNMVYSDLEEPKIQPYMFGK